MAGSTFHSLLYLRNCINQLERAACLLSPRPSGRRWSGGGTRCRWCSAAWSTRACCPRTRTSTHSIREMRSERGSSGLARDVHRAAQLDFRPTLYSPKATFPRISTDTSRIGWSLYKVPHPLTCHIWFSFFLNSWLAIGNIVSGHHPAQYSKYSSQNLDDRVNAVSCGETLYALLA